MEKSSKRKRLEEEEEEDNTVDNCKRQRENEDDVLEVLNFSKECTVISFFKQLPPSEKDIKKIAEEEQKKITDLNSFHKLIQKLFNFTNDQEFYVCHYGCVEPYNERVQTEIDFSKGLTVFPEPYSLALTSAKGLCFIEPHINEKRLTYLTAGYSGKRRDLSVKLRPYKEMTLAEMFYRTGILVRDSALKEAPNAPKGEKYLIEQVFKKEDICSTFDFHLTLESDNGTIYDYTGHRGFGNNNFMLTEYVSEWVSKIDPHQVWLSYKKTTL